MEIVRIGDKLVSKAKIHRRIERILDLRMSGMSQLEIAQQEGVDRSFISRLEGLGELRKGGRLALIGFPIENKDELSEIAHREGVEFLLLFNDKERWEVVSDLTGPELFNRIMEWIARLKEFDAVVFIGSDMRIRLAEAVLGQEVVVGLNLGESPIRGDRYVDPDVVAEILQGLKA